MSEHVLCMVLYLIELGLDNQVQESKEDEVRWVLFGSQLFSSSQCSCTVSDRVFFLLGALHRGALPRQLVPWNQSPLQPAPCHQLCQGAGSRDGARGEERGSAQHQHRGLFLRPGKQYCTAASHRPLQYTWWCYVAVAKTRQSFFWHDSQRRQFHFCTSCSCKKTTQVFKVNRRYSREHARPVFSATFARVSFCPPAGNGPTH